MVSRKFGGLERRCSFRQHDDEWPELLAEALLSRHIRIEKDFFWRSWLKHVRKKPWTAIDLHHVFHFFVLRIPTSSASASFPLRKTHVGGLLTIPNFLYSSHYAIINTTNFLFTSEFIRERLYPSFKGFFAKLPIFKSYYINLSSCIIVFIILGYQSVLSAARYNQPLLPFIKNNISEHSTLPCKTNQFLSGVSSTAVQTSADAM